MITDALIKSLQAEWRNRAACLGMDTDLFFPEKTENAAEAKQVCLSCPVREPCLEEAMSLAGADDSGIWGGASPDDRRSLSRRRRGDVRGRCLHPRCTRLTSRRWCEGHADLGRGAA